MIKRKEGSLALFMNQPATEPHRDKGGVHYMVSAGQIGARLYVGICNMTNDMWTLKAVLWDIYTSLIKYISHRTTPATRVHLLLCRY